MNKVIPTYDNGQWTTTTFENDQEWLNFVLSLFKEPGQYDFDETALIFNEQAEIFNKRNYYCNAPLRSKILLLIGMTKKINAEKA